MDITIPLIYQPVFNLIVVFYRVLGENLGLAIIAIALLSRLLTLPVTIKQRSMMGKSQALQAKMKDLREKHKNDKEKLNEEMMKLNSENFAVLAGCLPAIVQLIVFINVYNVIHNLITVGPESFNSLAYGFVKPFAENYQLNYNFFGIFDLAKHPSDFANNIAQFIPYLILMLLVGITQYFSMKLTLNMQANNKNKAKAEAEARNGKLSKKDRKKNKNFDGKSAEGKRVDARPDEDFGQIIQQSTNQTLLLFPILYTFLGYSFPAGLAIYWIVQNCFVIIQQPLLNRITKPRVQDTNSDSTGIVEDAVLVEAITP